VALARLLEWVVTVKRRKDDDMRDDWASKSRMEKIAGAMWPNLLSAKEKQGMINANSEQGSALRSRMNVGKSAPPVNYDHVPGLIRKPTIKSWWER